LRWFPETKTFMARGRTTTPNRSGSTPSDSVNLSVETVGDRAQERQPHAHNAGSGAACVLANGSAASRRAPR
jgi:hypothetical protein